MQLEHGMLRLATVTPVVSIANPDFNAERIIQAVKAVEDADIILTPELSVTGYTCGDLFGQETLIDTAWGAVLRIAKECPTDQMIVLGCPVYVDGSLYNCAVVLNQGYIVGIVPKSYLPNYKEFYEARWFQAAKRTPQQVWLPAAKGEEPRPLPFGTNLLFRAGEVVVGIEICEDLWVPLPPSSFHAVAGANVLLNLSASNETVGKGEYRKKLVEQQSARCIAAYAYCSSGPHESTADLVFGGHNLIYENGSKLAEAKKFDRNSHQEVADIDIYRLIAERAKATTFGACRQMLPYKYTNLEITLRVTEVEKVLRPNIANVFTPNSPYELSERCKEIFSIQTCGLAKRLESLPRHNGEVPRVVIGVSGGLDSTLALLVCVKTYDMLGWPHERIMGVTMPGFGTSVKTLSNANLLMETLGVWQETIDIREPAVSMFRSLGHKPFGIEYDSGRPDKLLMDDFCNALKGLPPGSNDLVFENVQARVRTLLLMSKGFVIGTGDLSESALGWCTYNGDHMSMYNVNASIPKTLVKFLVRFVADYECKNLVKDNATSNLLYQALLGIGDTVVSPELLPNDQVTEASVGPYELGDYFLFQFLRNGYGTKKIAWMAERAEGFSKKYSREEIEKWLAVFIKRFFSQQFKRDCVPNGPKVGSVSLSPRGDWRMPPDADPSLWQHLSALP